jgi:hypothetical protein
MGQSAGWGTAPRRRSRARPNSFRAAGATEPLADRRERQPLADPQHDGLPEVVRQPGDAGRQGAVPLVTDHLFDGRRHRPREPAGGADRQFAADLAGAGGEPPAEGGEFVAENGAEPRPEFGQGGAAELVAVAEGGGERLLDEVAGPAFGPERGGEFGVGQREEELPGLRQQGVERGVGRCGRADHDGGPGRGHEQQG